MIEQMPPSWELYCDGVGCGRSSSGVEDFWTFDVPVKAIIDQALDAEWKRIGRWEWLCPQCFAKGVETKKQHKKRLADTIATR